MDTRTNSFGKTSTTLPEIRVEPLTETLKSKGILNTPEKLEFGKIFTDRMFFMEYNNGWQEPVIKKYEDLRLSPAAVVLQYAQTIFEGMKAFKKINGEKVLFRPDQNIERFNRSAQRMCMPQIDPEVFMQGLKQLLTLEKDWVPSAPGCSLYIRPTYIGVDGTLGVKPSTSYYFYMILSPSGPYFKTGFSPIKIYVSTEYVRAAPGGVGAAKTGGNYAASLYSIKEAREKYNANQVLYLDATHHKFVEEVGSMNFFFVKDGTVYTTPLTGTILPGVTRDSLIQLCKDMNIPVREEAVGIEDKINGIKNNTLTEAFGSGTAAVVIPIGELVYKDTSYRINDFHIGTITQKLYTSLTDIQHGHVSDPHNWMVPVD